MHLYRKEYILWCVCRASTAYCIYYGLDPNLHEWKSMCRMGFSWLLSGCSPSCPAEPLLKTGIGYDILGCSERAESSRITDMPLLVQDYLKI